MVKTMPSKMLFLLVCRIKENVASLLMSIANSQCVTFFRPIVMGYDMNDGE